MIPGGMPSMLQPLDVSINKPFKDHMRAKWQQWMLAGEHTFTARGHIRKVELEEICRWISAAWNDIPTEMIAKSFRKCCITNAMDVTEDEEIWEEESDSVHSQTLTNWMAMKSCTMQMTSSDSKQKLHLNSMRPFSVKVTVRTFMVSN